MTTPPPPPPPPEPSDVPGQPRIYPASRPFPPSYQQQPLPPFQPMGYQPYGQVVGQPVGTNGMAVASMVLGIVGVLLFCLWIPSILAVIFGGVALGQIKRNPAQGGRGMAIAGLVLGLVVFVGLVLLAVFGQWNFYVRT